MTEIDLVEAARAAVFAAVKAATGDRAPTLDHVRQDTQPPFQHLRQLIWANEGGKYDPLLKIEVDVATIYRGADRSELAALARLAFIALHDVTLKAPGVAFGPCSIINGSLGAALADGVTYAALQTFELTVEPA